LAAALAAPAHGPDAAHRFALAQRDEPSLDAFLDPFPKGGDLHNHLTGALRGAYEHAATVLGAPAGDGHDRFFGAFAHIGYVANVMPLAERVDLVADE